MTNPTNIKALADEAKRLAIEYGNANYSLEVFPSGRVFSTAASETAQASFRALEIAIDALAAQTGGAGEAVAWQWRKRHTWFAGKPDETSFWSEWEALQPPYMDARDLAKSDPENYELRPLYLAAPTSDASAEPADEPKSAQFWRDEASRLALEVHALRGAQPSASPRSDWTLTAPDGRQWHAESALRCAAAEQRQRIPADVALARIFAAADEDDTPSTAREVAMEKALRELVACKDLKDSAEHESSVHEAALARHAYYPRQPKAWHAARLALKEKSVDQEHARPNAEGASEDGRPDAGTASATDRPGTNERDQYRVTETVDHGGYSLALDGGVRLPDEAELREGSRLTPIAEPYDPVAMPATEVGGAVDACR